MIINKRQSQSKMEKTKHVIYLKRTVRNNEVFINRKLKLKICMCNESCNCNLIRNNILFNGGHFNYTLLLNSSFGFKNHTLKDF